MRSIPECMASEIILMDPLSKPAVTLRIISTEFDTMDNAATFTFLFAVFKIPLLFFGKKIPVAQ